MVGVGDNGGVMSSTGSSVSTSGLVLPSTPLAEPGKEVPLVVNTPSRAKPPRHWIDLSIEERVQAVKDFGVPAFRCLLYTSPSPRDVEESRMPSSA